MSVRPRAILDAVLARLRDALAIADLRVQMDPFDIDDFIARESFREEAMRVVFGEAEPLQRADGGYDLDVKFGIFIAAVAEGRPDPESASADLRVGDLALDAYNAINADPYCGLAGVGILRLEPLRVFASQLTNKKGFALVAIGLCATIYEAIQPPQLQAQFAGTRPETWAGYSVNAGPVQDIPEPAP